MKRTRFKRLLLLSLVWILLLSFGAVTAFSAVTDLPNPIMPDSGETTLFQYDFEANTDTEVKTGDGHWTAKVTSAVAAVEVYDTGSNKLARFFAPTTSMAYPRLHKQLKFADLGTFVIQFSMLVSSSDNNHYMNLELWTDSELNKELARIGSNTKVNNVSIGSGNWVNVKIHVNMEAQTYGAFVNGGQVGSGALKEVVNKEDFTIRFSNRIPGNQSTYLDNVLITTADPVQGIAPVVAEDGTVNLDHVRVHTVTPLVPNIKAHPRLHLNDFSAVATKMASDSQYRKWYEKIKQEADILLNTGLVPYDDSIRGRILEQAREVMNRTYILSFAYQIEKEKGVADSRKYLERAVAELANAASYPDWSPHSFLVTSEMMHGFAVGYDWLYNDMNQNERDIVLNGLIEKGIKPLVSNYEGVKTGINFMEVAYNWNPVCNGSAIISALSIADEYPVVAEYILQNAAKYLMPRGLTQYAPEGAYPEGTMYWSYGTSYLTYTMSSLDSAVREGFELPVKFRFHEYPGIGETPEFPIYYNGNVGSFNFGDASSVRVNNPALFWFARKFDKPQYAWYQKKLQEEIGSTSGMGAVLSTLWYDYENADIEPGAFPLDKIYSAEEGKYNGMAFRSSWGDRNALYAAIQGGSNKANHMFLSLGTFMLESNQRTWITMRGVSDYNWPNTDDKATPTGQRWSYYKMRAEGQNTFIANPGLAADQNLDAAAKVVRSGSSAEGAFGILDMTQTNSVFESAQRGMYMTDNRKRLIIQDEITAKSPSELWWFYHTPAEITVAPDGKSAMLKLDDERMWVNIAAGDADARFIVMDAKPLPTSPYNPYEKLNYGHKLAVHLDNVTTTRLAVEFVPLDEGQAPPDPWVIKPMAEWQEEPDDGLTLEEKVGDNAALLLNSPYAYTNGVKSLIDEAQPEAAPVREDGKDWMPVNYVSRALGAQIQRDESIGADIISYKDNLAILLVP